MKQSEIEVGIDKLINLYKNGIDKDVFMKLIVHCTDGHTANISSGILNELTLDQWKTLYSKKNVNLGLETNQIEMFFSYMNWKFPELIIRRNGEYAVTKSFSNSKKSEDNFQFEVIIFMALDRYQP